MIPTLEEVMVEWFSDMYSGKKAEMFKYKVEHKVSTINKEQKILFC